MCYKKNSSKWFRPIRCHNSHLRPKHIDYDRPKEGEHREIIKDRLKFTKLYSTDFRRIFVRYKFKHTAYNIDWLWFIKWTEISCNPAFYDLVKWFLKKLLIIIIIINLHSIVLLMMDNTTIKLSCNAKERLLKKMLFCQIHRPIRLRSNKTMHSGEGDQVGFYHLIVWNTHYPLQYSMNET